MSRTLDMQNAEKRVFRFAIFEDGIWEIYLGSFFILMSFYPLTRELLGPLWNAILVLGLTLLLATLGLIIKKSIIQPRIGVVRFGSGTKKKITKANIVTLGLVLATFTLLILGTGSVIKEPTWERLPQWFSDFDIDLIFALVIIVFFGLIAYSTDTARFYLHGLLIGMGNSQGPFCKFMAALSLTGPLSWRA